MKLTTKSRVAIKALLDLATHGAQDPVSLATVAERLAVSLSYLEQLFRHLRARGFVKSARGPGGGYWLNKRLSAITVADVIDVVDGEPGGKRRNDADSADALWARLERDLLSYLRTVSLESLLGKNTQAAGTRVLRGADSPAGREEARLLAVA